MKFAVTVDGVQQSTRAFQTLNESISDFRPVWPEIHMYFLRGTIEQFESLGARGGQRWEPLSARYAKWKAQAYPGKPILVRTERLKRSLSVGGSEPDQIKDFQEMSATFGTRVPYARFHQRGTRRMPARPVLQPTQRDVDRMVSRLFRFAERGARDAGFQTRSRARFTTGAE